MKKILFFLIINFPLLTNSCCAQSFDNKWILGYGVFPNGTHANMDFDFLDTGNAIITGLSRNLEISVTNSVISDSVGNLLFFTNGFKINNKNNQLLVNGDSLSPGTQTAIINNGGYNINQGTLIIPKPNSNKYFVFSTTIEPIGVYLTPNKLYYSVIDMDLDSGNGAVTQKNQILFNDTLAYGMLTACKHANGRDWWVVVPKWNSNKYYKILITPNGIESYTIQAYGPRPSRRDYSGQIAFSPDGSKYARCDYDSGLVVLDFDRCTGMFTNYFKTIVDTNLYYNGVCFSPNSKLLYVSALVNMYQYNLEANDIEASKDTVAIWDGFYAGPTPTAFSQMQYAPNGKIYITIPGGEAYIGIIHEPNIIGSSCNVQQHFQTPYYIYFGLPNMPNYHLGALVGSGCDTLLTSRSLAAPSLMEGQGGPNPNPANNSFYYNYSVKEICTLQITNSSGLVVHTQTLYPWFGYVIIESTTWSNGVYVAAIKSKEGNVMSNHKVVVLH